MQFFVDNAQTILGLAGAIFLYVYHHVSVRVPAEQRKYVEQWGAAAVAMTEQKFTGASNVEKKSIAMDEVKNFFKAFNLPVPPDDVLSAFIEAAVNALPPSEPPAPPAIGRRASL